MLPDTVLNVLAGSCTVPVMTLPAAAVSVKAPAARMSPSTRPPALIFAVKSPPFEVVMAVPEVAKTTPCSSTVTVPPPTRWTPAPVPPRPCRHGDGLILRAR